MKNKAKYLVWMASLILFLGCQPKTNTALIDALKKQVEADSKALSNLESKAFAQLERDFYACDSLLQYLHPEEVEEVFPQLQLTGAYIEQFKLVAPTMQAEMDSTLIRLDQLKADAESHYFSDSLVTIYINDETQEVTKLGNQVTYFTDRFSNCQKELDQLKKKK